MATPSSSSEPPKEVSEIRTEIVRVTLVRKSAEGEHLETRVIDLEPEDGDIG